MYGINNCTNTCYSYFLGICTGEKPGNRTSFFRADKRTLTDKLFGLRSPGSVPADLALVEAAGEVGHVVEAEGGLRGWQHVRALQERLLYIF